MNQINYNVNVVNKYVKNVIEKNIKDKHVQNN